MYKNVFKNKKAVAFDLDGTLVNTSGLWEEALRQVCNGVGAEWPGFDDFTGVGLEFIWDQITSTNDNVQVSVRDLVQQSKQKFMEILKDADLSEADGFWDLAFELKEGKKLKLALVSNSHKVIVEAVLAKLGISQTFDVVVCGDDVKNLKPDPEMYKKAAKLLGVRVTSMVAFEDSPAGAKAAVDAGCTTMIVNHGLFSEKEYPKQVMAYIGDFSDVAGHMDTTRRQDLDELAKYYKLRQG